MPARPPPIDVSPYRIIYLDAKGAPVSEDRAWFAHDDDAIDAAGRSRHPHGIRLESDGRLVAAFPPWTAGLFPSPADDGGPLLN